MYEAKPINEVCLEARYRVIVVCEGSLIESTRNWGAKCHRLYNDSPLAHAAIHD